MEELFRKVVTKGAVLKLEDGEVALRGIELEFDFGVLALGNFWSGYSFPNVRSPPYLTP